MENQAKAVCKEIMVYKWIESEKKGFDIGQERAAQEWISRYYDSWFQWNVSRS
jgi:hypothetical protein